MVGNIKWDTQQSTGVEYQQFYMPSTEQFINSTCVRTNQSSAGIIYIVVFTEVIC